MKKDTLSEISIKAIFCLLLVTSYCRAQSDKPFIEKLNFEIHNGKILSDVLVDSKKQVWLKTFSGYLYRYDGPHSSSEFLFDYALSVVDTQDRLWSEEATSDHFIQFLNLQDGKTYKIRFVDESGQLIDVKQEFDIINDENSLWLITAAGAFYHANLTEAIHNRLVFSKLAPLPGADPLERKPFIKMALLMDNHGRVWFLTSTKLLRYNQASNNWTDFSAHLPPNSQPEIWSNIAVTNDGTTWIGIFSGQVITINTEDKVSTFNMPYRIEDVQVDRLRDRVWFTTSDGLFYVIGGSSKLYPYSPEPWQDTGVPSPTMRMLSSDASNNIWMTSNKGVHVMRAIHDNVTRIIPNITRPQQKANPRLQIILGLTKENNKVLWWINRNRELVRYDQSTHQERVFTFKTKGFNEFRSISFSAPFVLITTSTGELLRFDTRKQSFLSPLKLPHNTKWQNNFFIPQDSSLANKLWFSNFSTLENKGYQFGYWDTQLQQVREFDCDLVNSNHKNWGYETYLKNQFQFHNEVWFSLNSFETQLIKLSLDTHQCELVSVPFLANTIYAVSQNNFDTLWIFQGNHVREFSPQTSKILFDQPSPIKSVTAACVDKNGNFLISGDESLWHFDIYHKIWTPLFATQIHLDLNSGISPYFDTNSNIFYFLSHQGILAIDANHPMQLEKSQLVFTSINAGLTKTTLFSKPRVIRIPYDEVIEINYNTTPNVPSNLQHFRYRLTPTQEWKDLGGHEQLVFTHLPSDDYHLEMQTTFNHEIYGDSTFLDFTVLPPWWRSIWAYLLYGVVCSFILYDVFNRQRSRQRQFRQALLTERVFENISEGLCILASDYKIQRISKYPPAKPGALCCEPLEAVRRSLTRPQFNSYQ